MARLSERIGEWDDRSVIYRADNPDQRIPWGRVALSYGVGGVVVAVLLGVGTAFGVDLTLVVLIASVAFVVGYVIWRRQRNRRLTGSPRKWPTT